MASLKVRLVTENDDDLKCYFVNLLANQKWRPFLDFTDYLLACDPTGLFVGELNGKPMCSLAVLKYDPNYCYISCYVVEEEFRGKGYGMQLCETATRTISRSHNMAICSVENMVHKYESERLRFRVKVLWSTPRYDIDIQIAATILSELAQSHRGFQVQTIDQVDMNELYKYDTSVFGYQRKKFLQTFLLSRGSHARVVINSEGVIVGYAAARVAHIKEEGYKLGPLYADSLEIAQVLLKALFDEILEKGTSSSFSTLADIPVGRNVEAKKLIDIINGQVVLDLMYMTTKGNPEGQFEKCFAMASAEIG